MDSFSYTDGIRAALASCLPCFRTTSRSELAASSSTAAANTTRPTSVGSSSTDLEHLLRDPSDVDGISLHSHLGTPSPHRRARRRRRPKFSLTLFGYTLIGRPPIYLPDDDDNDDDGSDRRGRAALRATTSSSTLDSDAAPLDASTIERLTSPDHLAALAAERERARRELETEEEARRKAERRARRQERKVRARAEALMALTGGGGLPHADMDTFEGFQGSGGEMDPMTHSLHQATEPERRGRAVNSDGGSHSGDADDADLGGELYAARKKKPSGAHSGSSSDSRSRTSASFSAGGDATAANAIVVARQSIPYPHTEMQLPVPARRHRAAKRTSTVSSATSQSTSTALYTPVDSVTAAPTVATFPVPPERYPRQTDFPSVGLSGERRPKSLDPRVFLAQ